MYQSVLNSCILTHSNKVEFYAVGNSTRRRCPLLSFFISTKFIQYRLAVQTDCMIRYMDDIPTFECTILKFHYHLSLGIMISLQCLWVLVASHSRYTLPIAFQHEFLLQHPLGAPPPHSLLQSTIHYLIILCLESGIDSRSFF